MLKRVRQYRNLQPWERRVFRQAWWRLGWTRAAIYLRPFKRMTEHLEHSPRLEYCSWLAGPQLAEAQRIGQLVAKAGRYTPWNSSCLAQVLVTQALLQQRQLPGQFYLGVRKGEYVPRTDTDLSAHAWLQCGERVINGSAGHQLYTVLSVYSWGVRQ